MRKSVCEREGEGVREREREREREMESVCERVCVWEREGEGEGEGEGERECWTAWKQNKNSKECTYVSCDESRVNDGNFTCELKHYLETFSAVEPIVTYLAN
jgi:hypothetical protein